MLDATPIKKKYERGLILSGGGGRGAYHVGVWQYLLEMGWEPDIISGTSVGAVNAVAMGSGFSLAELIDAWRTLEEHGVYRLSWWKQIKYFFSRKGFVPLMDSTPMRQFIAKNLDITALREANTEVIVTAVNVLNSELKFFNNRVIEVDHIMASAALPVLFPWQYINEEPYWDGAVMMGTPLLPAIERKVKEAIVVLLSPVGAQPMELPRTRLEAIERVFDQSALASYGPFLAQINWKQARAQDNFFKKIFQPIFTDNLQILTVAPQETLGFGSILNFSKKQVNTLIEAGYKDASEQLHDFFTQKLKSNSRTK